VLRLTRATCFLWAATLALFSCRDFEAGPSDAQLVGVNAGAGGQGQAPNAGGATAVGAAGSTLSGTAAAAPGGSAFIGVAALEPSDVDGLALWLSASKETCEVEGKDLEVTSWLDLSGNNNDARELASKQRPEFIAETLNGRPTLRFDDAPSGLVIADHESLQFGIGDFTYVAVARLRNDPQPAYDDSGTLLYSGSGSLLAKVERAYPYKGISVFANYPTPDYSAPAFRRLAVQLSLSGVLTLSYTDRVTDDVFRVYTVRRTALHGIEIRMNGVVEGRSMISGTLDVSAPRSDLMIGGSEEQPLAGDISEIVALRGSVGDQVLLGLEKGLYEKYRL